MIDSRRLRFLVVMVAGVSLMLLLAARWAGRLAGAEAAAGRRPLAGAAPARAGAVEPEADLTFYRTLGAAPATTRRPGGRGAEPILHPAPDDAVPPGAAYVVQALATRDGEKARRLVDRLAGRGLPAAIVEDGSGDTAIYRVRIGRWRDRATAEVVAARLRDKDGLDPWVLQEAGP